MKNYEIGDDFVMVEFKTPSRTGGRVYKYTYASAGMENIEKMKELAQAGQNLETFIQDNVRKLYESKS